jgi:light-regulated signal transduction histidine kinase (bacteriophytochrome)
VALADVATGAWNDPAFLQRLRDVLLRDRELWDYELVQRPANGLSRTLLVNAQRMPLPDREERVILMTASDITPRKASEDRIRQLNRQLEGKVDQVSEVNRELEAFSYSVSHDLRAPLRHIAGFAEKLGKHLGEDADDKSRHYLDVIGTSARRMSALIDDLLVYSRLGRSALRNQPVDMQSMVDEVRAMLESNAAAEHPGHRIEWRIAPLPIVLGDENMLRQVWTNLLGNAVKYSMQRPVARIEVAYRQGEGGAHEFEVSDNGAGFDMQYAGKLFGVFQRLHKASEFPGTGVGLASVRRILLRHGGRIAAEAEPGRGATFRFSIPAGDAAAATDPGVLPP